MNVSVIPPRQPGQMADGRFVMDLFNSEQRANIERLVQDNRANAESEARKHGATDEEINNLSSDELFDWIAAKKREARRFLGSDADSSDDDDTELPTNRQGAQQGNVSKRRLFRYTGKMQGLGMAWFIFEKKDYTEEEFRSLIAHLELNEPWKFVQQNGGQMKEGNGEWAQIGINSYHSVGDKWLSSDFTKAEICLCGQKPDEATVLCKLKCVFPGHSEADYANGVRQCFKCFDIATAYNNGAQGGEAEARRAEREAKKKAEGARKAEEAKKKAEEAAKKKAAEEAAKKRKSLLGKRKEPEPAPEPVVQNLAQSKERLQHFNANLLKKLESIQKTCMQEMNNSMQTVMKTVNEQINTAMKNAKERMNIVLENAKEEANAAVKNATEPMGTIDAEVQDVTEEMREKEKEQLERDKIDLSTPVEERLVADAAKYGVTLTAKQLKKLGIVRLHDWFQKQTIFGESDFTNVRKNEKMKEDIFSRMLDTASKKMFYESMKQELFPEQEDYRIKYKDCVGKRISHESSWMSGTGVITKITKCSIKFKVDGYDTFRTVREHFKIDMSTEAVDTVPAKKRKPMEWEKNYGDHNNTLTE